MVTAHFDFTASQRYQVDISAPVEIGLKDINLDASVTLERNTVTGKNDVVVTQLISNKSDDIVTLYAFANLSGFSRQERTVAGLKPGQTIVRRFRFKDAEDAVRGHHVRVGLRETAGPAVLKALGRILEELNSGAGDG